jgi:hypothetical protein
MIHIVGAYDHTKKSLNNPQQASEEDLHTLKQLNLKIVCYDPCYNHDMTLDEIEYTTEKFKFDLVNDYDIVVDYSNQCRYGLFSNKNFLYLEPGCMWKRNLPIDLIATLYQLDVHTNFKDDWKTVRENCNIACNLTHGIDCFVKPQMRILGDFTYLNIKQMNSIIKYTNENNIHVIDYDENFNNNCKKWTNSPNRSLFRLFVYGIIDPI